MRLRQVHSPADQASWVEQFYSGHLNVVNGIVETENPDWILQLLDRGFREIEETTDGSTTVGSDDSGKSSVKTGSRKGVARSRNSLRSG